jgi:hypothetical protein
MPSRKGKVTVVRDAGWREMRGETNGRERKKERKNRNGMRSKVDDIAQIFGDI